MVNIPTLKIHRGKCLWVKWVFLEKFTNSNKSYINLYDNNVLGIIGKSLTVLDVYYLFFTESLVKHYEWM